MAKVRKRTWKNTDGSKSYSWIIDYPDNNGKRVIKCGFKTKADAENALAKAVNDLNSGKSAKRNCNLLFKDAAKQYISLHAEIYCKKSTVEGYKSYLKFHLLKYFGKMKLIEITPSKIQKFIQLKIKEELSSQTINHLIVLTGAILKKMVDDEVIDKNPVDKVRKLKLDRTEFRILNIDEVKAILKTAEDFYPDFYPLLFTAIFTGMRRGELAALTWDRINWINKKIFVCKSYHKSQLTTPKTKNSIRKIDMCNQLEKVLQKWKEICPKSDKNLVFPNSEGNYMDSDNMVKRRFNNVLQLAGVERIRFHDLRHTFVSLLISQNLPVKYIQSQVGHGSIKVTMDIYGHIMPEVTQRGIDALDSLF